MAQSILPNVDVTVLDGALGLASGTRDGVCAQIGESTEGDNLVHPVTDAGQVAALFGTGALADAIRDALGAGARVVLARRLPAATPGEVESVVHEVEGYYAGVTPDEGNTSTLDGGVSGVGTLVEAAVVLLKISTGGVVDEAAFIDNMEEIWADMYPTVATGGNVIVVSTVNGIGNWYHKMWVDAKAERNGFNVIDLHYTEHPQYRKPGWADEARANLGPRLFAQEILGSFLGSGETFSEIR